MYKVLVDKKVIKEISSLHPHDQKTVIKVTDSLPKLFSTGQSIPKLKKLVGEPGAWSLQIKDVRVLFYQNKANQSLEIYRVGYRGQVYK